MMFISISYWFYVDWVILIEFWLIVSFLFNRLDVEFHLWKVPQHRTGHRYTMNIGFLTCSDELIVFNLNIINLCCDHLITLVSYWYNASYERLNVSLDEVQHFWIILDYLSLQVISSNSSNDVIWPNINICHRFNLCFPMQLYLIANFQPRDL